MIKSSRLRKKIVAIFSLVSMVFNIFSPTIMALSLATPVHAQDSVLQLTYNSANNTLDLGSSFSYSLYYQTGDKIEAAFGNSNSVYLGTASTEGSTSHPLVRGIIKLNNQTEYFVRNGSEIVTVASVSTSQLELTQSEESWLNNPSTYGDLKTGVTYHAPFNQEVSVTFSTLPTNPGHLTFNKVTLTPDQIDASDAVTSEAYEITSDMADGSFSYALTLPNPSQDQEVGVQYSEDGNTFNNVNNVSPTSSVVTISNLNHFTIFVVVYDAVPNVSSTNYPSLGFQATQTSEFGDYIHLTGTTRLLNSITVTMSDWAKYSTYSTDPRYSGNSSFWSHPITINIYSATLNSTGTPATLLGTTTQNISIPWRPESHPDCGSAWKSTDGTCYNGLAFNAVFDMSSLNLTLPDDIIVGVAYNTNTWGYSPIGLSGPYESLNVAVPENQAVATGSDDSVSEVFWNTVTQAWYTDGGAAGYGVFRKDTNWTPYGTVAFKVETIVPDTTAPTVPTNGLPNNSFTPTNNFDFNWDDSIDESPIHYIFQSSLNSAAVDGVLTTGLWTSGVLPTSMIHSSGAPNGKWYWQVKAVDSEGNESDWSPIWNVTIDSVAPSVPVLTWPIDNAYTNDNSPLMQWDDSSDVLGVAGYLYRVYYHCSNPSIFSTCTQVHPTTVGLWLTASQYQAGTTADGVYYWQVRAQDNAGNQSDWSEVEQVTIDTVAPTKPIFTAPTNNIYTNVNSVTLTWNGGDDTGTTQTGIKGYNIRYSFVPMGGGSTVNWSSGLMTLGNPKSHSGNYGHGQGTYTIYVSTTDNAGNVSPESNPLVINYDNTAPIAPTITTPLPNQAFKTTPILNQWSAVSDASGIKEYRIEYIYDDGHTFSGAPYRTTTSTSRNHMPGLSEQGGVTIRVQAFDNAGNEGLWSSAIHYYYDSTAPIFSSKTTFSGWYNTVQTSTFTYTDPISGIVSGTPVTCNIAGDGVGQTCTVIPNVCDSAGNCNTTSITSNGADIDLTDPISTISVPNNSGNNSTVITNTWDGSIAGTSSDATSGVESVILSIRREADGLYWDGTTWVSGSESTVRFAASGNSSWTYLLTDPTEDTYTITSHAIDYAGNIENSYSITIILDKTIPEVDLSINPSTPDGSDGWYLTRPTITLTATDLNNIAAIEYQWDSQAGTWTNYLAPFMPESEGAHVLYYRGLDMANNYSEVGVKNIKWDQTGLVDGPLNLQVSPNPTSGDKSKVKWDYAKDGVGISHYEIQWKLNDLVYTRTVGSDIKEYEIDQLIEGNWNILVRAYDGAGHTKEASTTLVVDRRAPAAPTLTLNGTAVGSASLSWSSVVDAAGYTLWYGTESGNYIYGANLGNTTSYTVNGLGAGNYYFIVRSTDSAGNSSSNSNEVNTGNIVGAPGVVPGTPAEGFAPAEEVLGVDTGEPETMDANSNVLGTSSTNSYNYILQQWWFWLILLALISFIIYRIYRRLLRN